MKVQSEHTAHKAPVGAVYEDGLTTEELRELVSAPESSKEAGSAEEVRDRVIHRLREKHQTRI